MSVHINKNNQMVVVSENDHLSCDDYRDRTIALINILKQRDHKNYSIDDETLYCVLDILEDYMPTREQCEVMLSHPKIPKEVDNEDEISKFPVVGSIDLIKERGFTDDENEVPKLVAVDSIDSIEKDGFTKIKNGS